MARKKQTTVTITPPDDDDEPTPEELAELNLTEGGDLFRVTDELKATQGIRLMFVRTYPAGPDSAGYVGEMTPGEFTTDRVRELYGPGKYKVTIMGPKGILPGGGSVAIAKGIERPKDSTGVGGLAELLRTIEDRQAAQRAADLARRDELLKLAIPGVFTLLASMVGRNSGPDLGAILTALKPPPAPTLAELTTTLAGIQSLQGKPSSELSGLENMFKAMGLMREFAEGGGDGGKGSNWLDVLRDVVKEVVPAARPMLEQAAAAAAARAGGAPALPAPAAAPAPAPIHVPMPAPAATAPPPTPTPAPAAAPTAEPAITEGGDMWEMAKPIIRDQVNKLAGWAAAKGRVDLYAELFLTELPQIVAKYVTPQQALAWLQHPEWWTVVKAHYPELEPHYAWLDQFRSELILLVEDQIEEAAGGDAAG